MTKAHATGLAAAVLLLAWSTQAEADLIAISNFTFSGGTGVIKAFTPFDPTLGSLDSVNVSIMGQFDVLTFPTPIITQSGPQAYLFDVQAGQSFQSVISGGQGFSSSTPALFTGVGFSDGSGAPVDVPINFNYVFNFSPATDPLGFSLSSVGNAIMGKTGSFLPPPSPPFPAHSPIEEMLAYSALWIGGGGPVDIVDTTASGAVIIQYNYTEATSVPEPGSLPLFGGMALGLGWLTRRRAAPPTRRR